MAGYSSEDLERARAERDFRMNPPSSAPGQDMGNESSGWDDLFSDAGMDSSANSSALSGMDSGMGFGGNDLGLGGSMGGDLNSLLNPTAPPQQPQPQQQQGIHSIEDVISVGLSASGKYSVDLAKSLHEDAKSISLTKMVDILFKYTAVGGVLSVGGLVCIIFSLASGGNTVNAMSIMAGGLISTLLGGIAWLTTLSKAKRVEDTEPQIAEPVTPQEQDSGSDAFDDMDWGSDSLEESFDMGNSIVEEDDEEDDFWGSYGEESYEDDEDDEDLAPSNPLEDKTVEEVLEMVTEIEQGTQTRAYLIEVFMKVLPLMTPNFENMKVISEEDNLFYNFEQWVRDSATQAGMKEENLPELTELKENNFIYQIVTTRPNGMKEQAIADMVADIYSRDDNGNIEKEGVYATVDAVPGVLRINLFKSERFMISLGDVYKNIMDWMSNPKIKMPVVWGINELGKPVYCDAYDMNTLIISGVPRSGKSWKGQSLLLQLMMFLSSKEINFHYFDPKGKQSDYEYLSRVTPHSKSFTGDVHKIIPNIKKLIEREEPYRRKILESHDMISIKDFKKKYPDEYMPYVYIVMDELQTMMNSFSKEEKQEFNSLISIICSQLPNLGFRLIMFPHRIVNDIINKNIYELVSCRCLVKTQTESAIKSSLGVTKSEFPYSLVMEGDMGIISPDINKGKASFCHSEVITSSNSENRDIFRYVGEIWKKLEPDYSQGLYDSVVQSTTISEKATGGSVDAYIDSIIGKKSSANGYSTHKIEPKDNSIGSEYKYTGTSHSSESTTEDIDKYIDELDEEEDFWDTV